MAGERSPIPVEQIERAILLIRGQKVMLDSDLAELYQVETRTLVQAVRRNLTRFPSDFTFQLSKEEFEALRSQIVISNKGRGGRRYLPYAFTGFYLSPNRRVLLTRQAEQLTVQLRGGGGMDQELVQYLDERFHGLVHGLDQRFEQIDRRFEQIDRRFEGIDRRFDAVNERIEEVKRHSGVLIEDLRYQVRLVAEGFATFVEGRYAQDQARIDERFNETQALLRTSFEHRNRPN